MSILNVEKVSHGFGARAILDHASFRLLKGEHVGLVGANGEGKSTFLRIITGQLQPDQGKVEWSKRVTVGYLDQQTAPAPAATIREALREAFGPMFQMEAEMLSLYDKMSDIEPDKLEKVMADVGEIQDILEHNGFYTIDAKIDEIANGLGLGEIGLQRPLSDLSGGQRAKVRLTKLLLQSPTILLLDEPTNYLDSEHIAWLKTYLKNYENSFILISHDIDFLNDVINVVYHIENAVLTRYTGNYEQFQQMYAVRKRQEQSAYERQQQEIDRLEDFIARNKARVATRGMAKSRQKRLDKIELLEKPPEKPKPSFAFKEARAPGRAIVEGRHLVLGYGEPLTKPVHILLERGRKVAVRGVNGLGKSTLLKTLTGEIKAVSGTVEWGEFLHIGYFEQESSREDHTALEEIWREYPGLTNFEVRAALARCGLTNAHITSKMTALSGGENAKVRLCKLMLKTTNWLVLDEPTNHLDGEAKAELKKALAEFKGTILLVSHEPAFYEDWVTDVWNVENWTTKVV